MKKLLQIKGIFADQKTLVGHRRYDGKKDDDYHYYGLVDPFILDQNKLQNAKAFRRMCHKTQVASFPIHHHVRDRMSHIQEVIACAIIIGDILGLNIPLIQAIGLGHDIGHVPMGHPGEQFISEVIGKKFTHETMGVVIAQKLERKGQGLNLTFETLDGMWRHSGDNASSDMTPEAWVIRYADKIAYLTADYNDFERMGRPLKSDLENLMKEFGHDHRSRVFKMSSELCFESAEKGRVDFSDSKFAKKFAELRTLMYRVYPRVTEQDMRPILERIYRFLEHTQIADPVLMLAFMTDADIVHLSKELVLNDMHLNNTALNETLACIKDMTIDACCDPDLDWGKTIIKK